jgi:Acetyltransferase (GNAT) domain
VGADVELFDDFAAVEADAAGALDRLSQDSLYSRLSWFRLIAVHCPPPGKLLVLRARSNLRRAWLFLAVDHPRAQAYAAWYSLRVGAIGEAEVELLTAMAAMLRDGGVARLELAPIEDAGLLREAFRRAGWITFAEPAIANWRIDTKGMDFTTYWSQRPSRLRNTGARKAKAAGLQTIVHDRFDEAAWADYETVYRASWKPEEGSFPFLRALAEQEGAAGTLRLGLAYHEGRPVAAQLWLVEDGVATIHKLAYAEDAKAISPGTVLGEAMFRRAIDQDGVRLIDYGTGDDVYKRDWMDERRQLWRIIAYNPRTLRGLAGIVRQRVRALVRGKASG